MRAASASEVEIELCARLERVPFGRIHLAALIVIGIGSLFEIMELTMTGIFGAVFGAKVHQGQIGAFELELLLAATSIGAVVGSPLFGWLADRAGRRIAIAGALIFASIFSCLGAFSTSIDVLTTTRLLASFGIGAFMPLATTYLADILPMHVRGRAVMVNVAISGAGGMIGGYLSKWFDALRPYSLEGWRCTMLAGAAGTILCALAVATLPESARWLLARGRYRSAGQVIAKMERAAFTRSKVSDAPIDPRAPGPIVTDAGQVAPTLKDPLYRRRLLLIACLHFAIPWCTTGFANFTGWVFTHRGFSTGDAMVFQGVVMFGVSLGAIASLLFIDRVSRPQLLVAGGFCIALSALTFMTLDAIAPLVGVGLLLAMTGGVYSWVLILFSAELFPAGLRGRCSTISYGINRLSSIFVPFALFPLLSRYGEVGLYGTMAVIMSLSSLGLWLVMSRARQLLVIQDASRGS